MTLGGKTANGTERNINRLGFKRPQMRNNLLLKKLRVNLKAKLAGFKIESFLGSKLNFTGNEGLIKLGGDRSNLIV